MIEYFVHIDVDCAPRDLAVAAADIPARVSRIAISEKNLPTDWRTTPAPPGLAAIGDGFVSGGRAAILIVPSALAPAESNWRINPRHREFSKIRVYPAEEFHYDSRLFE
jgi:RES domain-containing protein